jgi:hypothetical protein
MLAAAGVMGIAGKAAAWLLGLEGAPDASLTGAFAVVMMVSVALYAAALRLLGVDVRRLWGPGEAHWL